MNVSDWFARHLLLNKVILVAVIILSYSLCRQTAIHIGKQTDVVRKKPSEHYEDIDVAITSPFCGEYHVASQDIEMFLA